MVAASVVIADEPGVGLGLELGDGAEPAAMEGRAPALLQGGAVEALAHRVVVGRAGWDAVVVKALERQRGPEAAGDVLGPVVGQHRPHGHASATKAAQHVGHEANRVLSPHGADQDEHDRPAGGGVDGGELVDGPDAFELADVEAVHGHQVTGAGREVAEPERLVPGRVGDEPGAGRGDGRSPGHPGLTPAQPVVVEQLLHRRLGDDEAPLTQAVGVLATADGGLGHRDGEQLVEDVGGRGVGQLGAAADLGQQGLEAVALGHRAPLIEPGAGDAEGPAAQRHVAGLGRVFQHAQASLVDDLVSGHGDGLPVLCGRNTRSITGPTQLVDLQPQPTDRKP